MYMSVALSFFLSLSPSLSLLKCALADFRCMHVGNGEVPDLGQHMQSEKSVLPWGAGTSERTGGTQ